MVIAGRDAADAGKLVNRNSEMETGGAKDTGGGFCHSPESRIIRRFIFRDDPQPSGRIPGAGIIHGGGKTAESDLADYYRQHQPVDRYIGDGVHWPAGIAKAYSCQRHDHRFLDENDDLWGVGHRIDFNTILFQAGLVGEMGGQASREQALCLVTGIIGGF